jgi:hypothetical protein
MQTICRTTMLVAALMWLCGPLPSASAHSGGKVLLSVKQVTAEPADPPGTYQFTVKLIDRDSGAPAVGYRTTIQGRSDTGGAFAQTVMQPLKNGEYIATVTAPPGTWKLAVSAEEAPGTDPAESVAANRTLTLNDKTAGTASAGAGAGSGGGGGIGTLALAVSAGAGAVFGAFWLLHTFRRRMAMGT